MSKSKSADSAQTGAPAKPRKDHDAARASAQDGGSTGIGGQIERLKDYFEKSKAELKKVVWPTRKETIATCGAVLILMVVMSLFLGVLDMALAKIVALVLS